MVVGQNAAPGACASGCTAHLLPAEGKPAALEAVVAPAGDGPPASFRLASVPPGRWRLEVVRDAAGWSCAADLGVIAPGTREVVVNWREPAAVGLRVLGPDDAPRAGVPVRAFTPASRCRKLGCTADPIGAWRCGAPAPQEAVTGEAGRATIALLDPAQEHLLVAGKWTAPEGLDARLLESLPGEPVTLRPRPSARVVGRLLDAADVPFPARRNYEEREPSLGSSKRSRRTGFAPSAVPTGCSLSSRFFLTATGWPSAATGPYRSTDPASIRARARRSTWGCCACRRRMRSRYWYAMPRSAPSPGRES